MAPILRGLLLLATLPLSHAIPTAEHQSPLFHESIGSRQSPAKTVLQRLKDSIVGRIWSVPSKSTCHNPATKSEYTAPANFRTKYGGDVVLRFKIKNAEEAEAFAEAVEVLYLDVWDTSSEWADVRVAKDMLPSLLNLLPPSLRNSHTPLIHDLAKAVYDTYPASHLAEPWRARHNPVHKHQHELFFNEYQPLSVIYPWLDLTAGYFPTVAESFSIGKSAEGRDIPAIRVGAPISDQVPDDQVRARQAMLVVGGSHAREWISVSTVAYMAWNFASRYNKPRHSAVTKFLQHYDIFFIPVLNPDGYEYSWGTDRLWRKTRQATALPFCPGIDLDRSYGYHWDGEDEKDNPCTDYYAGEYPFQAVESQVLVDWVVNKTKVDNVVFMTYLDLHSYSQKVLYPYSYSCDAEPPRLENLEEVAMGLAKSFRLTTGHSYEVGSACQSQFSVPNTKKHKVTKPGLDSVIKNGGSSLDYFYDMLRVRHTFQIKLRDTGTYGFLLPRENIVPSGREMFEALTNYGRWLLSNRGIETVDGEDLDPQSSSDEFAEDDDDGAVEWRNQSPEYLFRTSSPGRGAVADADTDAVDNNDNNNDEDEWERVYDEELRRRRR